MRHERDISKIRLVVMAVNGDRTSTIAYLPAQSGAQAGSTPAGRAGRTVGASAESVDAAEHRVKIHNAMGERLQSNQGKRRDAKSTTTSASHCSGRSSANRNGSRIQLSPCMSDRILSRLLATFAVLKPSHDLGHAAGT